MTVEISKTDVIKAVKISNTEPFVSSDFIAKVFKKRHTHILDKIKSMKSDLSAEFSAHQIKEYFYDCSYIDKGGREQKRYNLTRKGFDIVILSLTGKEALKYKIWFIDEFHKKSTILFKQQAVAITNQENDMWTAIRDETKDARTALTDAISKYELPQRIAEKKSTEKFVATRIMNYTTMIYKILNIELSKGINPRDILKPRELFKLEDTEYKVAEMIQELTVVQKCHYKQTYQLIKKSLQ